MTYVMSDIHGEYKKYLQMLELIRFSDEDELFVLGDVVDGSIGIPPLDILERTCAYTPGQHSAALHSWLVLMKSVWALADLIR